MLNFISPRRSKSSHLHVSFSPEVGLDPRPSFVKFGEMEADVDPQMLERRKTGKTAFTPDNGRSLAVPLDTMMKMTLALGPTMVKRCYKLNWN